MYFDDKFQPQLSINELLLHDNSCIFTRDSRNYEFIPQGLKPKINSAHITCSGSSPFLYYVYNLHRPDERGTVIDEQPLVLYVNTITDEVYGGIVQHGDWDGRRSEMPQQFTENYLTLGAGASWSLPNISIEAEHIYDLTEMSTHQDLVFRKSVELLDERMRALQF